MEKGKTNNPNGRPKGKPNKLTMEARQWLAGLIDKNRKTIERDLAQLEPKDRLAILEKLMSFVIPKANTMQISFDQLSDQQLNQIIENITKNLEE